jgi:hypothetical protein
MDSRIGIDGGLSPHTTYTLLKIRAILIGRSTVNFVEFSIKLRLCNNFCALCHISAQFRFNILASIYYSRMIFCILFTINFVYAQKTKDF